MNRYVSIVSDGGLMRREPLSERRERPRRLLEGYDEPTGRKRYRGFLSCALRNYAVAYLDAKKPARYDRRKHYEIMKRVKAADEDYALAIRYMGRVESRRLDAMLRRPFRKMPRYTDLRRRQEIGEALKPILRLVETDLNTILGKYHPYVPWRAHITFDYHRPEPNLETLRKVLARKLKRMRNQKSTIRVEFKEHESSTPVRNAS